MNGSTFPSPVEIATSLYGCWRLFLGDEEGLRYFRHDQRGFWGALWALGLALPPYLLKIAFDIGGEGVAHLGLFGMVVEAEILVVSGLIYALAIFHILPTLEREHRYFHFMVAYFWIGMAQVYILLVPSLLRVSGVVPDQGASFLAIGLVVAMLWWMWFAIRTTLDVNGGQAGIITAATVIYEFTFATLFSNLI